MNEICTCGQDDCLNPTADKNRKCLNCGILLCWDHVVRISIAVHDRGHVYENPFYLCRDCAKFLFGETILKKLLSLTDTHVVDYMTALTMVRVLGLNK